MEIFKSLSELPAAPHGRALAVGTFDGVHLGHRQVIQSALEWGRAHNALVSVVTFDPHPLRLLQPEDPPALLTPPDVKADLVATFGVDELVLIQFTDEFSHLEPEEFCRAVLAGSLQAAHVSVGKNFRFGHRARGDAALLAGRPEFDTAIVPLLRHSGGPVSSSRIRTLLLGGDVTSAAELLGAPYQLEGIVVEGDGRGRSLGMPTANLAPAADVLVPATGIYAGLALDHPAAISIGRRPTFERDGEVLVEVHLIDFDGDLYRKCLRVVFHERLRDERRFESAQELTEQMRRDVDRVREILC